MEPYTFDLDNPIESLDGVPADLRGMFQEVEGGYAVAEASKPLATRLNGLAKNLTETRTARTQAGKDAGAARELANAFKSVFTGVEGIEEVTPENAKSFLADLQAQAKKGGKAGEDAAAQIAAIKEQMSASHATELGSLQDKLANKDKQIEGLVKGAQITSALAKHEVVGGDVFRSFLDTRIKIVTGDDGVPKAVVVGDDGTTPVYNGAGDPMGVDEYVASLKTKDEFAPFFKSARKPGEGTRPTPGQRTPQDNNAELTPAQKISRGLTQMKHRSGR